MSTGPNGMRQGYPGHGAAVSALLGQSINATPAVPMSAVQSLLDAALADGARFDLLPTELDEACVEPAVWPAVKRVLESGWALPRYSCEGHVADHATDGDRSVYPYVQVACMRQDLARLVELADAAAASAHQVGEVATLHCLVLSPGWRAVALCFDSPRRAREPDAVLIERARERLVAFAEELRR